MRLITFSTGAGPRFGALLGDRIIELAGTHGTLTRSGRWPGDQGRNDRGVSSAQEAAWLGDCLTCLQAGAPARAVAERVLAFAAEPGAAEALERVGLAASTSAVRYLPPVARPGKVICLGLNYREHVAEGGRDIPTHPVLFAKFSNTLIGHREPIPLPSVSTEVDYEAELMVVIGQQGKNIRAADAMEYVAGYTVFNDVSMRDFQRRTRQWLQGKTFDGAGPIGPALVTCDEVPDPHALAIELRLNGETMQSANTSQLIFDIPTVIEYISQIVTLEPGDHIATGTPGGVGFARKPPVWLKDGDLVEIEIGSVGVLQNPVVRTGA